MAYNFKNLAEVELLSEVPEGCTAFAEVDGVVKRVPSKGLGGESGIKTVIIKDNYYDNILNGNSQMPMTLASGPSNDFTTSMTFDEVMGILASGEPLQIYVLGVDNNYLVFQALGSYSFTFLSSVPGIVIVVSYFNYYGYWIERNIYWDSEGIRYQPLD